MHRVRISRRLLGVAAFLGVFARAGLATATSPKAIQVASKAFAESVILAEMVTELERSQGLEVEHRAGLGGTRLVWDALISGSVDVYPEYTGTLLDEIFSAEAAVRAPSSESEAKAWLRDALAAHGVGMTEPLGFNNTYAVGLTAARARALWITRISELRDRPELRFGFSNEFLSRHDGWPGLKQRYGLPQGAISASLLALLVQALFELAERWLVPRGLRLPAVQRPEC